MNSGDFDDGRPHRPGVTSEFLEEHGIKRVTAAGASEALGYRVNSSGLLIPYFRHFGNGAALIVNGRPFYRVRLDKPGANGAKYLSPCESGAQLYQAIRPPMTNELVLCEGELKTLSLCEAGIPAMGLGGICGAMPNGELLSDLRKILEKRSIKRLLFVGDADTSFNPQFTREAAKIARALPEGCRLVMPRSFPTF
jgi:hypothetical protein